MEPIRWIISVFWIVFSLTLILIECFSRKTKKVVTIITIITVLLGVGLFAYRGSTLSMDMRVDSYPFADPFYYMNRPREDYRGYKAGFLIKEYRMDLTISNELHAEVEVSIDNCDLDTYEFTLYHGYILTSIHTAEREIPFIRQGEGSSLFENRVDPNLLLEEIDELQFLAEKNSNMEKEKLKNMSKQEKEAFQIDERRQQELIQIVDEKAAGYLFYNSPGKEQNLRIFFDYFTSETEEDYLELVERVVREELRT